MKNLKTVNSEKTLKKVGFKSITPKNFDCANLSPFMRELTGTTRLHSIGNIAEEHLRSLQYLRPLMEREKAQKKIEETLNLMKHAFVFEKTPPRPKESDVKKLQKIIANEDHNGKTK